ncbi:MAG: Asp-tRNA(Asn)/Glu-tRNA(Gln) amidotransferase subunit GatB [Gammaproteobacteria bacterium]|nr:Asp-tRNA(Asn)/Glu-tRNA(Gln) amidotransferase subunit GatB [Gammaproteobacteria bacterium]MYL01262.1 Asp-tRNA(Asn)/Glu-tRNA(Gln) amidotransferase subunit GatB [Gammaproteobacteria bacterium]
MEFDVVIGLEIHVQLATRSKMFSGASTVFGASPNTQACLVDLGFPGTLPVANREAVAMAARFGLATGGQVARRSVFARKNYFYPDLPKGYQISQFELPIVSGGSVEVAVPGSPARQIELTRAHLEEDAGKSLHDAMPNATGVDLNRAGAPLLEIVTEPQLRSPEEASACMRGIHQLVTWIGISDGAMQEGSLRCDANISLKKPEATELGTRTEIKNLNSFRFVERALRCEILRQAEVLRQGGTIAQETRLYDSALDTTRPMRDKEQANDYRYFPDPDLPPLALEPGFLEDLRGTLPELPHQRRDRFQTDYGLPAEDARRLCESRATADYFETAGKACGDMLLAARWTSGELAAALNRDGLDIADSRVSAGDLGVLLSRLRDGSLSGKLGKEVFQAMWAGEGSADDIIQERGLRQISDSGALEGVIEEVMAEHADQVRQYREGNARVFGFLVGQVMRATKGQANPQIVNELLRKRL